MDDPISKIIIDLLKDAATLSPLVVVFIILYKAKVLQAFASWLLRKSGDTGKTGQTDGEAQEFADLKKIVTNDYHHEFQDIKQEIQTVWGAIRSLEKRFTDNQSRVEGEIGYIKGRLNGHK